MSGLILSTDGFQTVDHYDLFRRIFRQVHSGARGSPNVLIACVTELAALEIVFSYSYNNVLVVLVGLLV